MSSKAQINVFLVFSVIVLFVGFLVFNYEHFLKNENNLNNDWSKEVSALITDKVELCLKSSYDQSLDNVFESGGYYEMPSLFIFDKYTPVSYYVFENQTLVPGLDIIETQLELSMKFYFDNCISNLGKVNYSYGTINVQDSSIKIDLFETNSKIYLDLPISVKFEGNKLFLKNFNLNEVSEIVYYKSVVEEFISSHNGDFSKMPISILNKFSLENGFTYEIKPYNYETVVYSFAFDENSGQKFIYNFAVKYDWGFNE